MIGPFIFLDIDGVLNAHNRHANGYCGIDAESVTLLNRVIEETGAKIIVSSAWRYFVLRGEMNIAGLDGMLATHGMKWRSVIDVLGPDVFDASGQTDRGQAIKDWFRLKFGCDRPARYFAIDDLNLGYTQHCIPFFQTDGDKGLAGLAPRKIGLMIDTLTSTHEVTT